MTQHDLIAWRGSKTIAEAASLIGVSVRSIINWERGVYKIPRYVALAISAVQMGLPPYGSRSTR